VLCICSWYFGKLKRLEAEKKLLQAVNDHGAFLIRDSESRRDDYSLSGMLLSVNELSCKQLFCYSCMPIIIFKCYDVCLHDTVCSSCHNQG
jgi:hypothetical protein